MKIKILKKIIVIFIISLMSITMQARYSFGLEEDEGVAINTKMKEYVKTDVRKPKEVLSDLQSSFGYSGDKLYSKMKLVTTVTIMQKGSNGNYWLTVGSNPSENGATLMGANGSTTGPGVAFNYRI